MAASSADMKVARDPHYGGTASEWGWDGHDLHHRAVGTSRWVKVRRVHPTPARIETLYKLMKEHPNGR